MSFEKQSEEQNSLCDRSKSKTEQVNKEETGRKLWEVGHERSQLARVATGLEGMRLDPLPKDCPSRWG